VRPPRRLRLLLLEQTLPLDTTRPLGHCPGVRKSTRILVCIEPNTSADVLVRNCLDEARVTPLATPVKVGNMLSSLRSLWQHWRSPRTTLKSPCRRGASLPRVRFRPLVESLEERALPSSSPLGPDPTSAAPPPASTSTTVVDTSATVAVDPLNG